MADHVPEAGCIAIERQFIAFARFGDAPRGAAIAEKRFFGADDPQVSCCPGLAFRDADLDGGVAAGCDKDRLENRHQLSIGES